MLSDRTNTKENLELSSENERHKNLNNKLLAQEKQIEVLSIFIDV